MNKYNRIFDKKNVYKSVKERNKDIDDTIDRLIYSLKTNSYIPKQFKDFEYVQYIKGGGLTRSQLNNMSLRDKRQYEREQSKIIDENNNKSKRQLEKELFEYESFMNKMRQKQNKKEEESKKLAEKDQKRNKLIFKPLNLEVIKKKDIPKLLNDIFENDTNIIGMGQNTFYKYIMSRYFNITREEVIEFLESKINYQLTRPTNKNINKPILADYPNQRWGIDLIDMNSYKNDNNQIRYILTVVDIFSRKVFLGMLLFKNPENVLNQFKDIILRSKTKPKFIISDNGTEFKGIFKAFCEDNDIKIILTGTYSPKSNAITERKNLEIRRKIRAIMTKTKSKRWVENLYDVENALNETYTKNIKGRPNDLWSVQHEILDENKIKSQKHQRQNAIKSLEKFKAKQYEKGDYVRISMSSIYSNIRKKEKQNDTKKLVVKWSPDIFKIKKLIHPSNRLYERPRYSLVNNNNQLIKTWKNGNKFFYADELLKVEKNKNNVDMTMEEALELNDVKPNQHDLII